MKKKYLEAFLKQKQWTLQKILLSFKKSLSLFSLVVGA